jgi:hypothetical protein
MEPNNTTIVISCYIRSTEWADILTGAGFDVRKYTKEDPSSPYNVDHNIGMEATAYLKYIMDSYNDLKEYTIFLHDEEFSWHHEGSIIDRINESVGVSTKYKTLNNAHNLPYFYWNDNMSSNIKRFYDDHLGEYLGSVERYGEFLGPTKIGAAQMIVHRDAILSRPYELYSKIYERFMSMVSLPNSAKETGILMEYYWELIFGNIQPIEWDLIDKIAVVCKDTFPYRANYSYQGIDFFIGEEEEPTDLSKYKWLIKLGGPLPHFNFDMFYTRFLDITQSCSIQESFHIDNIFLMRL